MSSRLLGTEFRTVPALPLALWWAAGVALVLSVAGFWHGPGGWIFAAAVLLTLGSVSRPAVSRRGMLALAAGMAITGLHLLRLTHSYDQFLPRRDGGAGAAIEGVVTEPFLGQSSASWFAPPNRLAVRVRRIRVGGAWHACSGRTVMEAPSDQTWTHGDRFQAEGAFVRPPPAPFMGAFNERRYLASKGATHRFRAVQTTRLGPADGWYALGRAVYRLRDRWLRLETARLSPGNAAILAAFTAGYRYGLAPETVDTFLRSGTIHVFAISGLHTGIVAGILTVLLLLLRVPFRFRYMALPVLLGAYVFVTGGAPSATRAWLMVTVYCLAHALFRPIRPLQAVSLAALILLAWNPLNLLSTGFQFSFTIVGFLLVGWRQWMPVVRGLFEKQYWKPERHRAPHWVLGLQRHGLQLLCAGLLAWLGSAGLVLCANALFIPATVPVNIGISLLLLPSFVVAFLKATLASVGFPLADAFLAGLLELLIDGIRRLAEWGGRPPASLAVRQPGVLAGLAYYALAGGLLLAPSRRLRAGAGMALVVLLGLLLSIPAVLPPRVTVLHGAGLSRPAIAVFKGDGAPPTVINTGGFPWSRELHTLLRHRGCDRIADLVVGGTRSESHRGADALIAIYRPHCLWLPAGRTTPENRRELQALAALQQRGGGRVRWFPTGGPPQASHTAAGPSPALDIVADRDAGERTLDVTGTRRQQSWRVRMVHLRSGDTVVQIHFPSGPQRRVTIPLTHTPKITVLNAE